MELNIKLVNLSVTFKLTSNLKKIFKKFIEALKYENDIPTSCHVQ